MVCGIEHRLWHFEEMGMGNEVLDERIIQGETKQEEEMLKTLSIAAGCLTEMPAAQNCLPCLFNCMFSCVVILPHLPGIDGFEVSLICCLTLLISM